MNGLIALVGSGEYLDTMDAVDRRLLAEARSHPARVVCVPASVERWAQRGLAHFRRLGAESECALITDRVSANDPRWARLIEAADLIYFSGGDPLYLYETLADTPAWAAVEAAGTRGAVFAGCSAGAMILGASVPDVRASDFRLYPAFNKIANCIVLPHFDRLESLRAGATAFAQSRRKDGQYLLGIDEHTAPVGRTGAECEVLGASSVSLLTRAGTTIYPAGSCLTLA